MATFMMVLSYGFVFSAGGNLSVATMLAMRRKPWVVPAVTCVLCLAAAYLTA